LLLTQHSSRVGLSLIDLGHQRRQCVSQATPHRRNAQFGVALLQGAHAASQHLGTLLHLGKCRGAANQRLRYALGQTLRLHQRLTAGRHLLAGGVGLIQHIHRRTQQQQQAGTEHGKQGALVLVGSFPAQQRQRDRATGALAKTVPARCRAAVPELFANRLRVGGQTGCGQIGQVLRGHVVEIHRAGVFLFEQSRKSVKGGHESTF